MEVLRNVVIMIATVAGCFIGWEIAPAYSWMEANIYLVVLLFGATAWLLASIVTRYIVEEWIPFLRRNPITTVFKSVAVIVLSAVVGILLSFPVTLWLASIEKSYEEVKWLVQTVAVARFFLPIVFATFSAWIGWLVFKEAFSTLWKVVPPKVVDTSALLSKKFEVLAKNEVIEGKFIILTSVLRELALLSELPSKRKGVLKALEFMKKLDTIEINPSVYTSEREVDVQLVEVAKALDARLVTADRAVAGFARSLGIGVIDLTSLTISEDLKVGDVVLVSPVKRGKEKDQFVAYTDMGNMIVIRSKEDILDRLVRVKITNVTPTEVGKVYFASVLEVLGGEEDESKGDNENNAV